MRYEEDYVMRMLKEAIEVVMRIALNKKGPFYELEEENRYGSEDGLYSRILKMADAGQINEAENQLLDELDPDSQSYFEMALRFYEKLGCKSEEFLEDYRQMLAGSGDSDNDSEILISLSPPVAFLLFLDFLLQKHLLHFSNSYLYYYFESQYIFFLFLLLNYRCFRHQK